MPFEFEGQTVSVFCQHNIVQQSCLIELVVARVNDALLIANIVAFPRSQFMPEPSFPEIVVDAGLSLLEGLDGFPRSESFSASDDEGEEQKDEETSLPPATRVVIVSRKAPTRMTALLGFARKDADSPLEVSRATLELALQRL